MSNAATLQARAETLVSQVRASCPNLDEARARAVAMRLSVWWRGDIVRSAQVAASDAAQDGISTPMHIWQTSQDTIAFAHAASRVVPIPVLEPITVQVRMPDPSLYSDLAVPAQTLHAAE